MTALRSGCRVQLAKASRSPTSAMESILARFPGIMAQLEVYSSKSARTTKYCNFTIQKYD
jgi:hypothetical protein